MLTSIQKRLEAGELGESAIREVDRDYLLRPGDLVAIRNAAYTFPTQPGQPRPRRIENGQVATVEAVDPRCDTLTLLLREPGCEPRLVEIDQARLRAEYAAGNRTAAVRLNYALHSFPAQGATFRGSATLVGHWSQSKQETYVGDTRAIYRHTVHVAREDLGTEGTDENRIGRYAQRISADRQRHASIRSAPDPTLQLAVRLPHQQALTNRAASTAATGLGDTSPRPSPTSATPAKGGPSRQPCTAPKWRSSAPVPTNSLSVRSSSRPKSSSAPSAACRRNASRASAGNAKHDASKPCASKRTAPGTRLPVLRCCRHVRPRLARLRLHRPRSGSSPPRSDPSLCSSRDPSRARAGSR
jgi:hypothetical protein